MVGRRDTEHRNQGDVHHGSLSRICRKNLMSTCMGPPSKAHPREPPNHFICGQTSAPLLPRATPFSSFCPRGASPVSPTHAIDELSCSCFSVDRRRRCLTISLSMTLSLVEVIATSFTERSLGEVDPWSGDQNPWAHAALLRALAICCSLPVLVLHLREQRTRAS